FDAAVAVVAKDHDFTPEPSPTRVPTYRALAAYLAINATSAWTAIAQYLRKISWPVPAERVSWLSEAAFVEETFNALHSHLPAFETSRLLEVLYPADPRE